MKRLTIGLALCGLMAAGAVSAETQVYYGFNIGISNAPPPPRIYFDERPQVVIVPGTTVYAVDPGGCDCDMFRSGSYWYASQGGYWYRARSYRGPFVVVDVRRVPRAVFSAPPRYWRHHPHGGPPGLTKRYGSPGRGHDKGQGRGHGKGHGKGHASYEDN